MTARQNEQGEYAPRIFLGPAGSEFVGMEPDGTPVTAGVDSGVGPMAEITEHVVTFDLGLSR